MLFNVQSTDVVVNANFNERIEYYGDCKQDIRASTWGDTGTYEMRNAINQATCYWSVALYDDVSSVGIHGDSGKAFAEQAILKNAASTSFIIFYKTNPSLSISIFLGKKSYENFQHVVDKLISHQHFELLISVPRFIGFRSTISTVSLPTLEEFYEKQVPLTVDNISFILKNKAKVFRKE